MPKKEVTITEATDHGLNQLESLLDQHRRRAFGEAARFEAVSTTETDASGKLISSTLTLTHSPPQEAKS
jgi:hypothetical protein